MTLVQTEALRAQRKPSAIRGANFIRLLGDSFAVHWMFYALIGFYALAGMVFVFNQPGTDLYSFPQMLTMFVTAAIPALVGSALLAMAIFHFYHIATVVRPKRPLIAMYQAMKADIIDPRRYIIGLPMFVALFIYMCIFSQIKANIPNVVPFSWDEYFTDLDYWLHLGNHPWQLLQPLIGYPFVTFMIAKFYSIWMLIMCLVWMWLAFDDRMSHLRTRFFFSFMLIWMVGGSLLAVLLSSTGPVYFGNQGFSPNPFADLMSYLHTVDESLVLEVLTVQDMLWRAYNGEVTLIAGISAMPSMHNATSLLFVLTVWSVNRKLAIGLAVFAAIIFIGSIHLGWHYAVDTYLAYIVTLLCWWVAGRFAIWHDNRPTHRRFEEKLDRVVSE